MTLDRISHPVCRWHTFGRRRERIVPERANLRNYNTPSHAKTAAETVALAMTVDGWNRIQLAAIRAAIKMTEILLGRRPRRRGRWRRGVARPRLLFASANTRHMRRLDLGAPALTVRGLADGDAIHRGSAEALPLAASLARPRAKAHEKVGAWAVPVARTPSLALTWALLLGDRVDG